MYTTFDALPVFLDLGYNSMVAAFTSNHTYMWGKKTRK